MKPDKWYLITEDACSTTEIMYLGFQCVMRVTTFYVNGKGEIYDAPSVSLASIDETAGIHAIKRALDKHKNDTNS